jgi:hypothetical protein
MQLEAKKYLFDMRRAAALVAEFTAGLSLEEYQQRAIVRAAVERQLQIVGEALAQLTKLNSTLANRSVTGVVSSRSGISSCMATPTLMIDSSGTSSRRSCRRCGRNSMCCCLPSGSSAGLV